MGVGVQDDLCNDAQVPYLSFSGTPVFWKCLRQIEVCARDMRNSSKDNSNVVNPITNLQFFD